MAFDGIVMKSVISELNNCLIGARVSKVYEPNKNEIILGLYNNKLNYALDININPTNYRLCLTTHSKPNPANALNFCMLLRKYLISFKIKSISCYDLERTLEIEFEGNNGLKDNVTVKLIIELMGRRSNIILVNQKNVIIDSIKHIITSTREILPAHEYTYPEITKKSIFDTEFNEFKEIVLSSNFNNIADSISNSFIGISTPFIENALKKLNISDISTSTDDLEKLYKYIFEILNNMGTQNISCCYINKKDYTIDLTPSSNNLNINFFIDDFYYNKEINDNFVNEKNNLLKIILGSLKKCSKKLENINAKLLNCEKMDMYKLYGELITANLYRLDNNSIVNNSSTKYIILENYYDNNKLISIPIDENISYSKNAEKYFKKYNKLKNTLSIVSKQKEETELELQYIESIIYSLEAADTIEQILDIHNEFCENVTVKRQNVKNEPKKDVSKTELQPITINGYTVYIGKNNKQNDYLTLHFASKDDLWFHVQTVHGSHIILKSNGKEVDDDTIYKCAVLAKQNSRASLDTNVSVDYTYIKNVRKKTGAKLGMVNYTNYKTIIVK